jgi:dTDP-L-rhamnose 4-epimerase
MIKSHGKKALVTGGAGFIGARLCRRLREKGFNVTVLDNLSPQVHGRLKHKASIEDVATFVRGDVRDKTLLKHALEGQEIVVHLAAETGTAQSMYEIDRYIDTNVRGTACLLEALISGKTEVEKLILASSRAVYGEGKYRCKIHGIVYPESRAQADLLRKDFDAKCPCCNSSVEYLPTDETSAIKPTSIYGISKYSQEQLTNLISRTISIPAVILRYQNVYGPGQSLTNPYTGILSIFSKLLKSDAEITVFEDGLESRDFVYIDDAVAATLLAIETEIKATDTYNVGSGESKTVLETVELLAELYSSASRFRINGDFRKGDIRHNLADLTKIKKAFGFEPKVNFNDGLASFVEWVNTQYRNKNLEPVSTHPG